MCCIVTQDLESGGGLGVWGGDPGGGGGGVEKKKHF